MYQTECSRIIYKESRSICKFNIVIYFFAGQCILTASENNTDACSLLSQEDMLSALLDITKSPHTTMLQVLFKTTITGMSSADVVVATFILTKA